jgi:hypothetical protein
LASFCKSCLDGAAAQKLPAAAASSAKAHGRSQRGPDRPSATTRPHRHSDAPPARRICGIEWGFSALVGSRTRAKPQDAGDNSRINLSLSPPCGFIAAVVNLAMMPSTQRHRELVTDLAPESGTRMGRVDPMVTCALRAVLSSSVQSVVAGSIGSSCFDTGCSGGRRSGASRSSSPAMPTRANSA